MLILIATHDFEGEIFDDTSKMAEIMAQIVAVKAMTVVKEMKVIKWRTGQSIRSLIQRV